ncbi:MAG: B12-binding domain-containing radical SAM protein [Myxococcales bacterium]
MPKLLLSSVCRPFGGAGEGDSVGAELFHAQVTRAQGPFSLRQVIRVWAIDYLAENLETPTVTLHYPSKREFVRELRSGGYSHVGLNFVVATFHKVREMVALVRKHAPGAQVILGGYGTVLPDELLRPWADAICREEGVGFLRRVLGEKGETPIRPPHACIPATKVLSHQQRSVVGHVTAGLGCPNGCDFCCTSHFFKRQYVRFLETGRDIYEALLATRARARADGVEMQSFVLIDEDFFIQKRRARQFLDCVREGGEPLSLMGFGSVRGLSQFTAREVAEMGFELVWTAFEGKKAGYRKQQGRPLAELYRELQSVGCAQLSSMIIGFPYQTEATIRAEFDELMALEPALVQCLIYFAFPGTPFHAQVIAEDRYHQRYRELPDLRRWDGFAMHFEHPNFASPEKLEALQRELYRQDYERLGPSVLRLARVWLEGYRNLAGDASPLLRARAERLRADVRGALPALSAVLAFPSSPAVRERARALRADIIRLTGAPSAGERVAALATPALFAWTLAKSKLRLLQQPGLLRTTHRLGAPAAHTAEVFRLQGGRFSGLAGALRDDLEAHLHELLQRVHPDRSALLEEAKVVTARAQGLPASLVPPPQPPLVQLRAG